jgi:hypothetical protein
MAVWKETQIIWNGKQRILKPGSCVFGIKEFADKWECSQRTISKWLHYLHDTQRIVLETCSRGTIATICNWEVYQATDDYALAPTAHEVGSKYEPSSNQVGLSEEGKKERREEERENTAHADARAPRFDLEAAYRKYPLKKGKSRGMKILRAQIKTQEAYDALLVAIARYAEDDEVRRGFIKHFSTFAGEWRDWVADDVGTKTVSGDGVNWDVVFGKESAT